MTISKKIFIMLGNARTFLECFDSFCSRVLTSLFDENTITNTFVLLYLKCDDPGPKGQKDWNFRYEQKKSQMEDIHCLIDKMEQIYSNVRFKRKIIPTNEKSDEELMQFITKRSLYCDTLKSDKHLKRALQQAYNFQRCSELITEIENENNIEFDYYIVVRPDIYFLAEMCDIGDIYKVAKKDPNNDIIGNRDYFYFIPKNQIRKGSLCLIDWIKNNKTIKVKATEQIQWRAQGRMINYNPVYPPLQFLGIKRPDGIYTSSIQQRILIKDGKVRLITFGGRSNKLCKEGKKIDLLKTDVHLVHEFWKVYRNRSIHVIQKAYRTYRIRKIFKEFADVIRRTWVEILPDNQDLLMVYRNFKKCLDCLFNKIKFSTNLQILTSLNYEFWASQKPEAILKFKEAYFKYMENMYGKPWRKYSKRIFKSSNVIKKAVRAWLNRTRDNRYRAKRTWAAKKIQWAWCKYTLKKQFTKNSVYCKYIMKTNPPVSGFNHNIIRIVKLKEMLIMKHNKNLKLREVINEKNLELKNMERDLELRNTEEYVKSKL